jgi:Sec-independent protein translocase protein TatA
MDTGIYGYVILGGIILAVLVIGSKKLPELAKAAGRAVGMFKIGKLEVQKELKDAETALKP